MKAVQIIVVIALFGVAGYLFLTRSAKTSEVPVTVQELKFPNSTVLSVLVPKTAPAGFGKAPVVFFHPAEGPVKLYTYEQGDEKTYMVAFGGIKKKVPAQSVALAAGGIVKVNGKYTDAEIKGVKGLQLLAVKCNFDQ